MNGRPDVHMHASGMEAGRPQRIPMNAEKPPKVKAGKPKPKLWGNIFQENYDSLLYLKDIAAAFVVAVASGCAGGLLLEHNAAQLPASRSKTGVPEGGWAALCSRRSPTAHPEATAATKSAAMSSRF